MDIEKVRTLCLQLPHTSESIKYGDQLCFLVAGKSFCSANIKFLEKIKLKVPDDEFEMMCEREGISPAPFGGARFKWIQVDDFHYLNEREWHFYINQSYEIIKASLPKKVLKELSI